MKTSRRKLEIGGLLLLVNSLFGWGALAFCSLLAIRTEFTLFYLIGLLLYALSWILLGVGLYLTGSEGFRYARSRRKELSAQFFSMLRKMLQTGDIDL
ncbi:MAG: hypothetical protein GY801_26310 [bacterium]|nr:hypothetical protein [bacterium]